MPDTSIIIPTLGANETYLRECLVACQATTGPDTELIVQKDNKTFSENCNLGATIAEGDILIFLNDDTIPTPGWLDNLLVAFEDPEVGVAGCMLRYPHTLALQHAGVYFDAPDGILRANNVTDEAMSETRDVDAVTGACLAIRAHLFHECEGFDEGFRNGYEDVDLCLRVRAGGWRVRYVAESVVLHHESASGEARWAHVQANIDRLQQLWSVSEHPAD